MITTRIIPVATATSQEFLIEMSEHLCRPFCINGGNLPSGTIAFSAGTPVVVNGNAVVTISATATVLAPNSCGCATPQVFTETFDVAFAETATNAITLTPGTTIRVVPDDIKCCKARGVRLVTTLEVTIA